MNIFDYLYKFWNKEENVTYSTSEAALFFYLLNEANKNRWKMPIICCTDTVSKRLRTSKQNIVKARDGLKKKGLIKFVKGKRFDELPRYTLLSKQSNEIGTFMGVNPSLLSLPLSQELPQQLSQELSPYNIKDNNTQKENKRKSSSSTKIKLSLSVLEPMLLNDQEWQNSIVEFLIKEGITLTLIEIKSQIETFFLILKAHGVKEKEVIDCRKHFFNWIKTNKTKRTNEHNIEQDPRRGVGEITSEQKDYRKPFYTPNE